ncbi:MAG TPA: ATP-binding protein [Ilumatobacteraceae bacterium]
MEQRDARQPPDVSHEFENEPDAPQKARRALDPLFHDGDPIADDVKLVASELVTNVVLHTDSGGVMQAWSAEPFVLNVTNSATGAPQSRTTDDDVGGRGLHIVAELADEWGTTPTPAGKTVRASFERPAQEQADTTNSQGEV